MIEVLSVLHGLSCNPQIQLAKMMSKEQKVKAYAIMIRHGGVGFIGQDVYSLDSPCQLRALIKAGVKFRVVKGQELVKQELTKAKRPKRR